MPVFQLEWSTYDGARQYYFQSPPNAIYEEFKALCDRLVRESAEDGIKSIARATFHQPNPESSDSRWWMGYDYFVEEVAVRLLDHGYTPVVFPTVTYHNGMILQEWCGDDENNVLGEDLTNRVVAYNRKFEEDTRIRRTENKNQGGSESPL